MESDLMDPLRIMGDTKEEDEDDDANAKMGAFARIFAGFSRSLDAAVETNGTTLARRKAPVKELLANGYNAVTLVKEEPNIVPILILEGHYTSLQLKQLGFHWDILIQGGLSENTFVQVYKTLGGDFLETFVVGLSSLLALCSRDITQIPRLKISAEDLGRKVSAAELFAAKMDTKTMINFEFTIEEWAKHLRLQEKDLSEMSPDTLRDLIKHDPNEKVAFDHFFSTATFSLEPEPEREPEDPKVVPVSPKRSFIDPRAIHRSSWRRPARPGRGPVTMRLIRR